MAFKKGNGATVSTVGSVKSTDQILIDVDGSVKAAAIQTMSETLGFFTQGSASAEIHAIASGLISAQVSAQVEANNYITSASASVILNNIVSAADYVTSGSVSSQITAFNYLTSASVSSFIESFDYLTSASVSSFVESFGYVTSSDVSALISVQASAQIAEQISANDYVTSTDVSGIVSVQVATITSAQISAQVSAQVSSQVSTQVANQIGDITGQGFEGVSTYTIVGDTTIKVSNGSKGLLFYVEPASASAFTELLFDTTAGGFDSNFFVKVAVDGLDGNTSASVFASISAGGLAAFIKFNPDASVEAALGSVTLSANRLFTIYKAGSAFLVE